MHTKLKYY